MQIVYADKELATCAGDKSFAVKKTRASSD